MVDGLGRSNNPNKLSPQEPIHFMMILKNGSNNTNKLSPQEQTRLTQWVVLVQIIQINLVLKNNPD